MGTEGIQAGGNGPNMKIMNPFHAGYASHSLSNLFGVQVGRHSFREHMHGLREKSPRAPDDAEGRSAGSVVVASSVLSSLPQGPPVTHSVANPKSCLLDTFSVLTRL